MTTFDGSETQVDSERTLVVRSLQTRGRRLWLSSHRQKMRSRCILMGATNGTSKSPVPVGAGMDMAGENTNGSRPTGQLDSCLIEFDSTLALTVYLLRRNGFL